MSAIIKGELGFKIVALGPRGAATRLFEQSRAWTNEDWQRADGQGAPGEPVMDWASFNVGFTSDDTACRAFFFGTGVTRKEFRRLGPETKTAMFRGMDHLVIVLDQGEPNFADGLADAWSELEDTPNVTVVGLDGHPGGSVTLGARELAVTPLPEADIAWWFDTLLLRLLADEEANRLDEEGDDDDDVKRLGEAISMIVAKNMERIQVMELEAPWQMLLSPIWEPGPNGTAVRRAFIAPASMREHYYEGPARELLQSAGLIDVVLALSEHGPSTDLADLKALYCDAEAPFVQVADTWSDELGGLSLLLADIARRARAGVTARDMLDDTQTNAQTEALHAIETEYASALSRAPMRKLLKSMRPMGLAPRRPWWKFW